MIGRRRAARQGAFAVRGGSYALVMLVDTFRVLGGPGLEGKTVAYALDGADLQETSTNDATGRVEERWVSTYWDAGIASIALAQTVRAFLDAGHQVEPQPSAEFEELMGRAWCLPTPRPVRVRRRAGSGGAWEERAVRHPSRPEDMDQRVIRMHGTEVPDWGEDADLILTHVGELLAIVAAEGSEGVGRVAAALARIGATSPEAMRILLDYVAEGDVGQQGPSVTLALATEIRKTAPAVWEAYGEHVEGGLN